MACDDEKINIQKCNYLESYKYNQLSCQLFGKPVVVIADADGGAVIMDKKLFTGFCFQNNETTLMGRCVVCYSFINQNHDQSLFRHHGGGSSEQSTVLTELLRTLVSHRPNVSIPLDEAVFSVSSYWFCQNCSSVCQQFLSKAKESSFPELREKIIAAIQLSTILAEKEVNSVTDEYWNKSTSVSFQIKAAERIREYVMNQLKLKHVELPKNEQSITTAHVKVEDSSEGANSISRKRHQTLSGRFPCDICGAVLTSRFGLRKHDERVHKVVHGQWFACMECGEGFQQERLLDMHLKQHTGEQPDHDPLAPSFSIEDQIKIENTLDQLLDLELPVKLPTKFTKVIKSENGVWKDTGSKLYFYDKEIKKVARNKWLCPLDECSHSASRKQAVIRHVNKTHLDQSMCSYKCDQCELKFYYALDLTIHIKREHETHECDICGATLPTHDKLISHKSTEHRSSRPYSCKHCGKGFKVKGALTRHESTHTPPTGKTTLHTNRPTREIRNKRKKIVCLSETTRERFWRKTEGKWYFRDMEVKQDTQDGYMCPYDECRYSNQVRGKLSLHVNKKHGGVPRRFECDQCEAIFPYRSKLARHRVIHTRGRRVQRGPKPSGAHPCSICKENFATRKALSSHKRRKHSGIKPHICKFCDMSFTTPFELKVHVRRQHTKEKPFVCPFCGQRFFVNQILKQHVLMKHNDKMSQTSVLQNDNAVAKNAVVIDVVKDKPEPCLDVEIKEEVVGGVIASDENESLLPKVLWKTDESFDPFQIY